jgi:hypothetical protein
MHKGLIIGVDTPIVLCNWMVDRGRLGSWLHKSQTMAHAAFAEFSDDRNADKKSSAGTRHHEQKNYLKSCLEMAWFRFLLYAAVSALIVLMASTQLQSLVLRRALPFLVARGADQNAQPDQEQWLTDGSLHVILCGTGRCDVDSSPMFVNFVCAFVRSFTLE